MKLSEGVEIAIHCMAMLSGLRGDAVLPAAALAEFHGVSPSYLLKHLQALSGAGLLVAVPGPRGGYRLARPATDISFLDIIVALEGPRPAFRCAEVRQRGPFPLEARFLSAPCGINAAMLRAEKAYRAELAKVRIADFAVSLDAESELDRAIAARNCRYLATRERPQT